MTECLYCRTVFEQKPGKGRPRKHCSDDCGYKYDLALHRARIHKPLSGEKGTYLHVCEKCGQDFRNYFKVTRFCPGECFRNRNLRTTEDGQIEKHCPRCKEYLPRDTDHFSRSSQNTRDGLNSYCKACDTKKNKQWRMLDPIKTKTLRAATHQRNIITAKKYQKKTQPARNANEKARKMVDPAFALKNRIRVLMYHTLRHVKAGRKWQDLVGYSIDDLRRHIEKQFRGGMSWARFMAGEIHIDHKIPVAAFNFTMPNDPDFKKCWAIKNLRPMWAVDNLKKSDRLDKPFQPSLTIGGSSL